MSQIEAGDSSAAEQLLLLVYGELRKLAAAKLAREQPGQTLQATALVHEAYLRLVQVEDAQHWNGRGHFFSAAAEAMRRILVENARRRARVKHGGDRRREDLAPSEIAIPEVAEDLLALDESLQRLAEHDPQAAELVKLRYFAGLTIPQAAEILGVSPPSGRFLMVLRPSLAAPRAGRALSSSGGERTAAANYRFSLRESALFVALSLGGLRN